MQNLLTKKEELNKRLEKVNRQIFALSLQKFLNENITSFEKNDILNLKCKKYKYCKYHADIAGFVGNNFSCEITFEIGSDIIVFHLDSQNTDEGYYISKRIMVNGNDSYLNVEWLGSYYNESFLSDSEYDNCDRNIKSKYKNNLKNNKTLEQYFDVIKKIKI